MMFVEIEEKSGRQRLININEIESIISGDGCISIYARANGEWKDYAHSYNWWKSVLVPEITTPGKLSD